MSGKSTQSISEMSPGHASPRDATLGAGGPSWVLHWGRPRVQHLPRHGHCLTSCSYGCPDVGPVSLPEAEPLPRSRSHGPVATAESLDELHADSTLIAPLIVTLTNAGAVCAAAGRQPLRRTPRRRGAGPGSPGASRGCRTSFAPGASLGPLPLPLLHSTAAAAKHAPLLPQQPASRCGA